MADSSFRRRFASFGTGAGSAPIQAARASAGNVVKQGMLRKQGGSHKSWKDRWFILTSTSLAYYKQRDDAAPISSIELSTVSSCRAEPNDTKAKLTCLFSVATEGRVYLISAKSDIERDEWVQSIGSQLAGGSGGAITETAASGSVAHHSGAAAIPVASSDDKPTQWVRDMHADFSGVPVLVDVPHVELIQSMRSMLRSEIIPDVTFMVSGTKFAAHRCILSVRCPHLAQQSIATPTINIKDVSQLIFARVIDYVYTGHIDMTLVNVVDIYAAATSLHIDRLRNNTIVFIRENLSVASIVPLLKAAHALKQAELVRFLYSYVHNAERFPIILSQPEVASLASENRELYLQLSQVLSMKPEQMAHSFADVQAHPDSLRADLARLRTSLDHADVRIFTRNGEIWAHRCIIAARCYDFIPAGTKEAEGLPMSTRYLTLAFPTVDADAIDLFLQTVYGSPAELRDIGDTCSLIDLADLVKQEPLVGTCEHMLRVNLSATSALRTLMVASEYELKSLRKEALAYIVKEAPEILHRHALKQALASWPWVLVDIIRSLVRGADNAELTEDAGSDDD